MTKLSWPIWTLSALDGLDQLILRVMDVQGRAAAGRYFDSQIVDGAAGVLAGDLEDQISAGPRFNSQAIAGAEDLVRESRERAHCDVSSTS
jgi:hypothetical protein